MTQKNREHAEAAENLREWFPVGSTVYTILRHVSRSGMSREIGVLASLGDGDFRHPNYAASKVLGWRLGRSDSVKVSGCGMDMGFHLAYAISATIWPEYRCTGEKCTSPDHQFCDGKRGPARDGTMMHKDGYALNHRWL